MKKVGDGLTFDFGELSGADVQRLRQEVNARGYKRHTVDEETRQNRLWVANTFFTFVRETLTRMGLIDKAGISRPRPAVSIEVDLEQSPQEILEALWNKRAKDWAVVESPSTYAVTFATLLEHFEIRQRGHRETILSLGSGPGLYETFLGALTLLLPDVSDFRIVCVDSAREMTRCHQAVLKEAQIRIPGSRTVRHIKNVEPRTGDMLALEFETGSVDQIICNNALQWTPDWRKAVAEMARVINPQGLGSLYLFVHRHPMTVYKEDGSPVIRVGDLSIPELLDCLESNRFAIQNMRQIGGKIGTGQMGRSVDRVFIRARYRRDSTFTSWRDCSISSSISMLG